MAVAGSTASTWKDTFRDGVVRIMDNWRGLQLAVEQQFGGPDSEEKHVWLKGVTADFMLDNDNVDKDELEEYIAVLMDQEFDTILEDSSTMKVAVDICELFRLCSTKQLEAAKLFISEVDKSRKKQGRHGDKSDGHKNDCKGSSSVTMAMEQLCVGDKSLTINDEQCDSDGHHSNSDSKHSTLEVDHMMVANDDDNDGWEVVKRKKR